MNIQDNYLKNKKNIFFSENIDIQNHREKLISIIENNRFDKIFVDLNDDQYCIDLAAKNINSLKRILKPNGTITAQVGSQDKKPKQVKKWLSLFEKSFGNTSLDRIYIPSFDCSWNFASSLNK